jgi:hypothetical protein
MDDNAGCVTKPSEREGYVQLYDGLLDVFCDVTHEELAEHRALRARRAAQRAEQRAVEEAEQAQREQEEHAERERLRTLAATSQHLHVVLQVPETTSYDALLDLTKERLAKLYTLRTGKQLRAAEEDVQQHEYWIQQMMHWPSWARADDPGYDSRRQTLQENLETRRAKLHELEAAMATCVADIEHIEAARKRYLKLPSTLKLLSDRRAERDRAAAEAKAARTAEALRLEREAEEQLRAALPDQRVPFHQRYVRFVRDEGPLELWNPQYIPSWAGADILSWEDARLHRIGRFRCLVCEGGLGKHGMGFSRWKDVPCSDPLVHMGVFRTQIGGYMWSNIHICNLSLQLFQYLLGPTLAAVAWANVPKIVPAQLVYNATELQYADGRPRVKPGHWCYDCRQKCQHDGGPVRCERCSIVNDYGAARPLHQHIETVARTGAPPQRIRIEPLQFCSGKWACVPCGHSSVRLRRVKQKCSAKGCTVEQSMVCPKQLAPAIPSTHCEVVHVMPMVGKSMLADEQTQLMIENACYMCRVKFARQVE